MLKSDHIAIFDTFKTKNTLTFKAKRQRGIIAHLVLEKNPQLKTRISIARAIAKNNGALWQNIYSGIFNDLDRVLIPFGLVKEAGRLPRTRGPKVLQLEGIAFYELTESGILVASSLEEVGNNKMQILESYVSAINSNDIMKKSILLLIKEIPSFIIKIVSTYIYACITAESDKITPITIDKLHSVLKEHISIEREFIDSYDTLSHDQKQILRDFFKSIC